MRHVRCSTSVCELGFHINRPICCQCLQGFCCRQNDFPASNTTTLISKVVHDWLPIERDFFAIEPRFGLLQPFLLCVRRNGHICTYSLHFEH